MDISELIEYAREKYHLQVQHPWSSFPVFRFWSTRKTEKWFACFMRQWDYESGVEIQRADFKVGRLDGKERRFPFITSPFRMKGPLWVGVIFDDQTQPEVIYHLFDQAMAFEQQRGYTIVLEQRPQTTQYVSPDPPLTMQTRKQEEEDIPAPILQMMKLYEYGNGSFEQKCKNFYRQGKLMENYEDQAPYRAYLNRYFPTYHDLNVRQLRGYFTWRTEVRKGQIQPYSELYAYLYAYELINDIGVYSAQDSLQKLFALKEAFMMSTSSSRQLVQNLTHWMYDYVVIHQIPKETALSYLPEALFEEDKRLTILRDPQDQNDDTLFQALLSFAKPNTQKSLLFKEKEAQAKHLFAQVWRYASEHYHEDGSDLFTACFGKRERFVWHPLSNAIYWAVFLKKEMFYEVNGSKAYVYEDGVWYEERYDQLHFSLEKFQDMLREIDRKLRIALKVGHYLKVKPEAQWIDPYIDGALQKDKKRQEEASRPQVQVNLLELEQIRQDALVTRDSLLTEEELQEDEDIALDESIQVFTPVESFGLDALHTRILWMLVQGQSIDEQIQKEHLLPTVVTDTINEVLFDEIGDNILECDGTVIQVVEDYRDEILELLGGEKS